MSPKSQRSPKKRTIGGAKIAGAQKKADDIVSKKEKKRLDHLERARNYLDDAVQRGTIDKALWADDSKPKKYPKRSWKKEEEKEEENEDLDGEVWIDELTDDDFQHIWNEILGKRNIRPVPIAKKVPEFVDKTTLIRIDGFDINSLLLEIINNAPATRRFLQARNDKERKRLLNLLRHGQELEPDVKSESSLSDSSSDCDTGSDADDDGSKATKKNKKDKKSKKDKKDKKGKKKGRGKSSSKSRSPVRGIGARRSSKVSSRSRSRSRSISRGKSNSNSNSNSRSQSRSRSRSMSRPIKEGIEEKEKDKGMERIGVRHIRINQRKVSITSITSNIPQVAYDIDDTDEEEEEKEEVKLPIRGNKNNKNNKKEGSAKTEDAKKREDQKEEIEGKERGGEGEEEEGEVDDERSLMDGESVAFGKERLVYDKKTKNWDVVAKVSSEAKNPVKKYQVPVSQSKFALSSSSGNELMDLSLDLDLGINENDFGRAPEIDDDKDKDKDNDKTIDQVSLNPPTLNLLTVRGDGDGTNSNISNLSFISDITRSNTEESLAGSDVDEKPTISASISGVVSVSNLDLGGIIGGTHSTSRVFLFDIEMKDQLKQNKQKQKPASPGYETMFKMSHIKVTEKNKYGLRIVNTNIMKKIEYINAGGDLAALWRLDRYDDDDDPIRDGHVPWHVSQSLEHLPKEQPQSYGLTTKIGKHIPLSISRHKFEEEEKEKVAEVEKSTVDMTDEEYYFHQLYQEQLLADLILMASQKKEEIALKGIHMQGSPRGATQVIRPKTEIEIEKDSEKDKENEKDKEKDKENNNDRFAGLAGSSDIDNDNESRVSQLGSAPSALFDSKSDGDEEDVRVLRATNESIRRLRQSSTGSLHTPTARAPMSAMSAKSVITDELIQPNDGVDGEPSQSYIDAFDVDVNVNVGVNVGVNINVNAESEGENNSDAVDLLVPVPVAPVTFITEQRQGQGQGQGLRDRRHRNHSNRSNQSPENAAYIGIGRPSLLMQNQNQNRKGSTLGGDEDESSVFLTQQNQQYQPTLEYNNGLAMEQQQQQMRVTYNKEKQKRPLFSSSQFPIGIPIPGCPDYPGFPSSQDQVYNGPIVSFIPKSPETIHREALTPRIFIPLPLKNPYVRAGFDYVPTIESESESESNQDQTQDQAQDQAQTQTQMDEANKDKDKDKDSDRDRDKAYDNGSGKVKTVFHNTSREKTEFFSPVKVKPKPKPKPKQHKQHNYDKPDKPDKSNKSNKKSLVSTESEKDEDEDEDEEKEKDKKKEKNEQKEKKEKKEGISLSLTNPLTTTNPIKVIVNVPYSTNPCTPDTIPRPPVETVETMEIDSGVVDRVIMMEGASSASAEEKEKEQNQDKHKHEHERERKQDTSSPDFESIKTISRRDATPVSPVFKRVSDIDTDALSSSSSNQYQYNQNKQYTEDNQDNQYKQEAADLNLEKDDVVSHLQTTQSKYIKQGKGKQTLTISQMTEGKDRSIDRSTDRSTPVIPVSVPVPEPEPIPKPIPKSIYRLPRNQAYTYRDLDSDTGEPLTRDFAERSLDISSSVSVPSMTMKTLDTKKLVESIFLTELVAREQVCQRAVAMEKLKMLKQQEEVENEEEEEEEIEEVVEEVVEKEEESKKKEDVDTSLPISPVRVLRHARKFEFDRFPAAAKSSRSHSHSSNPSPSSPNSSPISKSKPSRVNDSSTTSLITSLVNGDDIAPLSTMSRSILQESNTKREGGWLGGTRENGNSNSNSNMGVEQSTPNMSNSNSNSIPRITKGMATMSDGSLLSSNESNESNESSMDGVEHTETEISILAANYAKKTTEQGRMDDKEKEKERENAHADTKMIIQQSSTSISTSPREPNIKSFYNHTSLFKHKTDKIVDKIDKADNPYVHSPFVIFDQENDGPATDNPNDLNLNLNLNTYISIADITSLDMKGQRLPVKPHAPTTPRVSDQERDTRVFKVYVID